MTTTTWNPQERCHHTGCARKRRRKQHPYCEKHLRARGLIHPKMPRDEVVALLEQITAQGFSLNVIGKEAGVEPASLHRVYSQQQTLHRSTYNAVAKWYRTVRTPRRTHTSVWPSQRRLQALYAAGMSTAEMVAATGCDRQTLRQIALGKKHYLNTTTAQKIDAMWKTHSTRTVTTPSRYVPRNDDGTPAWAVPLVWNNIDDPDEVH